MADLGGGGGARGGISTPEKNFPPFSYYLLLQLKQYHLHLSIEKEIAQDLQDEDIINEFAANDKKQAYCFVLNF